MTKTVQDSAPPANAMPAAPAAAPEPAKAASSTTGITTTPIRAMPAGVMAGLIMGIVAFSSFTGLLDPLVSVSWSLSWQVWAASLWGDLFFMAGHVALVLGLVSAGRALLPRNGGREAFFIAGAAMTALGLYAVYFVASGPMLGNLVPLYTPEHEPVPAFLEWSWNTNGMVPLQYGWVGLLATSIVLPGVTFWGLRAPRSAQSQAPSAPGVNMPPPEENLSARFDLPPPRMVARSKKDGSKEPKEPVKETKPDPHALAASDPHTWVKLQKLGSTADLPLPELLIDEVIGQDEAVEVAKKAARQRRHLLLLGDPGTGKSMIAKAMAQILPNAELNDVLCLPNLRDQNIPHIQVLPGSKGRIMAREGQKKAKRLTNIYRFMEIVISLIILGGGAYAVFGMGGQGGLIVGAMCLIAVLIFVMVSRQLGTKPGKFVPNLLIERPAGSSKAPYVDATGAHAGALLGDVRHDPFQSGGLETPTHLRVEPGAIHRADKGLLFIDEINVLRLESQQALLTALQDRKYSITGQSERSSGAQAKTEPVPCDFILVAAGNLDVLNPQDSRFQGLHPALRSRIRGYGYEVYVRSVMEDTDENRRKLLRFVAQEVRRDGQIPHFSGAAVAEIIREAQRRSGHTGKLTLRLRELGGLVRTAGDIARDENASEVNVDHVLHAKRMSQSLEYQVTRRGIEVATAKEAMTVGGEKIGTAIGCAFMGTGETGEPAGIVVPVEADATVSSDRQKGTLYVGGGLERDATVADTVGAVVKRLRGSDMAGIDLHVQALLQQQGADVQALSAAAAVACISALEDLPVRQDTVVLGSLAVTGRLRSVEGITQMVEGAADLGYTRAIVPFSNKDDILLEHSYRSRIDILLAKDLAEALDHTLGAAAAKRLVAVQNALHRKAHPKK